MCGGMKEDRRLSRAFFFNLWMDLAKKIDQKIFEDKSERGTRMKKTRKFLDEKVSPG